MANSASVGENGRVTKFFQVVIGMASTIVAAAIIASAQTLSSLEDSINALNRQVALFNQRHTYDDHEFEEIRRRLDRLETERERE